MMEIKNLAPDIEPNGSVSTSNAIPLLGFCQVKWADSYNNYDFYRIPKLKKNIINPP